MQSPKSAFIPGKAGKERKEKKEGEEGRGKKEGIEEP